MGKPEKKSKVPFFRSNITTVMSVALVLFLLGMVAFLGIATQALTNSIKENIGFDVTISDNATDAQINELKALWKKADYVSSFSFISKEDAIKQWQKETGEDLVEVLGVNPLSSEFEVRVKPTYANSDSITKICNSLKSNPAIDNFQMHKDVIDTINANVKNIVLVLLCVAAMLLIISFALINNTIRLAVYSRRFIIHTMKLVGAKPGFIRRPFILTNMLCGVIASVFAMVLLSLGIFYLVEFEAGWTVCFGWKEITIVYAALMLIGVLLCAIAAFMATNRFIHLDYDRLFTT